MDAFERVVELLLEREGYWVRTSYKVKLTKEDKKEMGIPSSPRWELDVVAYKPQDKSLLVVECKSFLNSPGVSYKSFSGISPKGAKRYKLFTRDQIRKVVFRRLQEQLSEEGTCVPLENIGLCLAAGHIRNGNEKDIRDHCQRNGWRLMCPTEIAEKMKKLAESPYENDAVIVTAKLALRHPR